MIYYTHKTTGENFMKTVYFDMDGTIADLYGVENWLENLKSESVHPYAVAKPLQNFSTLARFLNKIQKNGFKIGIISWGSYNATPNYFQDIVAAKQKWLKTHLKSVKFDKIFIVPHGTPKSLYAKKGDILFDDEEKNRTEWGENAYRPEIIFSVLKSLI